MNRMTRMLVPAVVSLVLLIPNVAHAALRSDPPVGVRTTTVRGGVARVKIRGFAFRPATITISRGGVVRWKNRDSVTHTSTGSSWDSGRIAPGDVFRHRFRRSGTFDYHCTIHPNMTGTVIVR
jgi:plastocyanin